ncbi:MULTISPECIES: hypothetical protein [unclassified Flavobacterium]|uniref:hypothetical protein n=1 Tax=unclassified Flavobacterium TaxID=196869 RepID=UPI001F12A5C1|nr:MULTISPECIES: hypothetical protein [unclassified Flavobacterium]UMY65319.1 hypothetical protein MKO97_12515 [Flavobacterium sp. HJ-32-4]
MYKKLKDYDSQSVNEIIDKELVFHLGNIDIADDNVQEMIRGKITNVILAGNYPNMPLTFEITDEKGEVRKVNVYEVKKISD